MAYEEGGFRKGKDTAFSFPKLLGKFFGFIIGFAIASFIILIPISMIFQNNALASYYYNKVTDPILNTGAGNYIKKGVSSFGIAFSEKKQAELLESYSWKSSIDENSIKKDLGVKITSFRATNNLAETQRFQKIEAIAEGYASSTEPTEIKFSCLTEKDKLGEISNKKDVMQISGNEKQFFTIKCIYPKKINNDEDLFEIDTNKATDSQTIRIRATYDFATESYIPIYFIKKDVFDTRIEGGGGGPVRYNIFEENNIQDEHLNKQTGIAESVYTKGPVKFELRSQYTQPYNEEGPFGEGSTYILDMKINDDISWTGNLEQINELDLYTPEEIDIISENFEYSTEEDNFKVYKAKDSLIQELNDLCKPAKQSILKELIDEDCWRRGNIVTSIEFSINDAPDEISKTFIRAKVNYKFSDEKQDTITFLNTV